MALSCRLWPVPVQDDERERQLRQLFNLNVPSGRKRADIDGFLRIDGREIAFELKSSTGGSISTVRDFGPAHIRKWSNLHWIFGFYNSKGDDLKYCLYGSPRDMKLWIEDKQRYVLPDLVLKNEAVRHISTATLHELLGPKEVYSRDDAKWIMKNQWVNAKYDEAQDLADGYSPRRMVEILQVRCAYVMGRGATLNNPHIPAGYFSRWPRIEEDHAARLRQMVRSYLANPSAAEIDDATL